MTSDLLIPGVPVRSLPIALDGDLVIDFRNRDPSDATAYLDYPAGVTGVFTIYLDLKKPGAHRITVTATPQSYHCVIKIEAAALNATLLNTLWSFRLVYPDTDLPSGYNKVVTNGMVVRSDGVKAP